MTDTNPIDQQGSTSSEPTLEPREWDAVAGTVANILDRAVVGGLPGLFKRWQSRDLPVRLLALSDTPQYGIEGLRLLLDATWNSDRSIRDLAVKILALHYQSFLAAPVPPDAPELFQECGDILFRRISPGWLHFHLDSTLLSCYAA